jgi:hypothetical protein
MSGTDEKKLLVFISHASEDNAAAKRLTKRLKDDGFDPWLDLERLLPGQDWNLEIEKAMRESGAILLCFSKESVAKESYIQKEYKRAMRIQEEKPEGTIFVIPVRLDECELPFYLREIQWVDYPEDYDRLLAALQIRSGSKSATNKKQSSNDKRQVQLVLDGDFENFDPTKQKDLIGVLAALLHTDVSDIRILKVYSGSIVIILELPTTEANRLEELALKKDFRLMSEKILSIQVEGHETILLSNKEKKSFNTKPTASKSGGSNIIVHGNINVGGDFISRDQYKTVTHNEITNNISSPADFVAALNQLKVEIEVLKSQPNIEPAIARRLNTVEGDITDVITEAEGEAPTAERIKSTLESAKDTMDRMSGSIGSAVTLGTTLGNLALIAWKVFGG